MNQLEALRHEKEKICILVPNEVNQELKKKSNDDGMADAIKQEETEKKVMKTNETESLPSKKEEGVKKGGKKRDGRGQQASRTPKVALRPEVVDTCRCLVDERYPTLGYNYESLFLGNPQQLLVYRRCHTL